MKTKLTLIILLLTSFAYQSFAFKIIIRGGGGSQRFHYIYVDEFMIKCTGKGSNYCPGSFSKVQSDATKTWFNTGGIIDYVNNMVESGNSNGEANYQDEVPVKWQLHDDGNIEIDIEECGVQLPEEGDNKTDGNE